MDNITLTALKESIAKWEKNAKVTDVTDMLLGWRDCPLCRLFYYSGCDGCPVAERTGMTSCEGTPYDYFEYKAILDDVEAMAAAASREVEFLKSLLPEGENA